VPTGTQGSKKGLPQLSVPDQLLDGAPFVAETPHLCQNSASPCIFGPAPLVPTLLSPV